MHLRHPMLALSLVALHAIGCGGGKPAGGGAADGAATSEPAPDAAATADAATPADTTAADGGAGAATSAPTAKAPAGPAEAKKDADAIVLEITVAPKGKAKLDDAAKNDLIAAANEIIHASSKLALPTSQGVTAPRKVLVNLLVEDATIDKKKQLAVRLEMTGVSKDGQCPLFSLGNNVAMSDGKVDNAKDVAELRKGALKGLFDQLEMTSPTVKPTNNCTHNKK